MTIRPTYRRAAHWLLLTGLISVPARADLLVEQWQGGGAGQNGLSGVDAVIASRPPDVSGLWDIIDFTDDPAGFAGEIPGSSPWPLATLLGQSGTGATANTDFAARITTTLTISVADTYRFRTYSDDGVRLRIGGSDVILDNSYHPEIPHDGSIFLTPGTYPLELVFFEGGGEASLEFTVAQGSGPLGHVGAIGGPVSVSAVPEPSTWAAGVAVLLAVGGAWYRRRQGGAQG